MINDPQRMAFPGIYSHPSEIAAEAASRIAPESPNLKRLFGVNRDDLYEIGKDLRGNLPGTLPGAAANPKGSAAAEKIMTPNNVQRILDVNAEAEKYPALVRGMDPWYVMTPYYKRMVELLGPERAAFEYRLQNTLMGMASPGSEVTTEIPRGSAAYFLHKQGRFPEFMESLAIPQKQRAEAGVAKDIIDVPGHIYHRSAQAEPMDKFLRTGEFTMTTPKVPMYIEASGVPETGFQTQTPVGDAHWSRAVGLGDTRTSKKFDASVSNPEMTQLAPWWRDAIAKQLGIESVPAQARTWGAFSGQTGVTTPIGSPKLEMIADKIAETAQRLGVSPETARDMVITGEARMGKAHGGIVHMAEGGMIDSLPEEAIKNTIKDPQAFNMLDMDLARLALLNQQQPQAPRRMAEGGIMNDIYNNVIPAQVRTYAETMFGNRSPITEKNFSGSELDMMRDAIALSRRDRTVTNNRLHQEQLAGAKNDKERMSLLRQGPSPKIDQTVGYQHYPNNGDDSVRGDNSVGYAAAVRNTLGRFAYNKDADGNLIATDTYKFRDDLPGQTRPTSEYAKMSTAEKLGTLLKDSFGKDGDIGTLLSRAGSAFIGADGRPVNVNLGKAPFAQGGAVHMAGGGRPPLRSLDEVPSDEYLKAELARINAAPTVRANSADETANYARYVAERAAQPIEMPARPDYTSGFSVLEKPTYGSEVPGTTPTIDQQRFELTMKGQQDAANKQYRAQQGDALAGMDPTGTLAVTDAARTMGLGMLALPVHAGRSAFHYLQHGNMKDAPTGMDYEEFMSPRTPEGAELVEEIGTAGSRLTGSEMAFGMNPSLWAYAPPTVAQMRAGLKLGAERAAPVLGKINRAVRSGYDSGLIPQPGMSIKDVTPKVLAPANEQGFYSPTEAAGLNLKRQSGNGQAFLNDILKGENVRAEEVNAMGLNTFLKDKKNVTAAEVQDYIAKNKIELGEGVYSNKITEDPVGMAKRQEIFDAYNPAIRQAYDDLNTSYDHPEIYARIERLSKERDEKADAAYKMPEPRETQFDQYAIPGGDNYREVVITLPQNKADSPDLAAATKKYEDAAEAHRLEGGMDNLLRMQDALYESQDLQTRINYESSHWQEPNVLAHVRLSDRVTDGKKTLLIDEVQSDWHQQARDARTYQVKYLINQGMSKEEAQKSVPKDYGYIKPKSKEDREKTKSMNAELDRLGDEYTRLGGFDPSDANKKENAEVRDRIQTLYNQLQSEEQADESGVPNAPYKDDWYQLALRRAIKEAVDGGFDRVALPTGEKVAKRFNVSDEKGMIKYYDEIYPTYLKKFGKKYGANVGSTTVDANGVPEPLHYMDITPAMRKEFSTGIHMKKGGKVSFASNVDAMRNELTKAK
jgi:hypothetical protein